MYVYMTMIALKTEKNEHAIHICMTCFHSLPRNDNGAQVLKMLLLCKWMTKMHTKCLAENSVV